MMDISSTFRSKLGAEFLSQIITSAAMGLLIVLLARLLNPEDYGLLFLSMSVFTVAHVFSRLGIPTSAGKYIAEYQEVEQTQIPHIIKSSFVANISSILSVSIILLAGYDIIGRLLKEPDLVPFLLLGVPFVVFWTLSSYSRTVLQGLGDIEYAAILQSIDKIGRLLGAIGLVLLGFGALGALGGFIIGVLLSSVFGLYSIYIKHYKNIDRSKQMEEGLKKRMLRYNIPVSITSLSSKINNDIDTILIGFFLNPVMVSYYVLGKQIIGFAQMPAVTIGFAMAPTYGRQKAGNQISTASRNYTISLIYTLLLLAPASAGVAILAPSILSEIFGSKYNNAAPILQLFSVLIIIQAIAKITDSPLDYLGQANIRAIALSVSSIGNLLLNIILIPTVGVLGAVGATILTQGIYVLVLMLTIHSELNLESMRILLNMNKILIITLVMSIVVYLLSPYIVGIITLGVVILVGIGVWAVMSVITGIIDYNLLT